MGAMKIHEQWCKKQQEDFDTMMTAVDDFCAASLGLSSGNPQAFTQFIQARDNFKTMFTEMNKHYRYVE
jgi:hypothetical protein